MLIDGEKYACEACIRGHRVSSCNHSDRELVHVARKGRPISQCQHCRGQRKARAQHTNCDCGAKGDEKDQHHSAACRCNQDKTCICGIKKDKSAQIVHDNDSPKPLSYIKNHHDNKPIVFTGNGHHKPAHKFNDAHNQLGSPYKIPSRASSVNHHSLSNLNSLAQRSHDSLPLTKFARPHHESPLAHQLTPRQIKSEHNSPMMRPVNAQGNVPNDLFLSPFDSNAYGYSPFTSNSGNVQQNNTQPVYNFDGQSYNGFSMPYSQPEEVQSQSNVDWDAYDFNGMNNDGNNLMLNDPTFLTNSALASEQFGNLNLGMTPSSGDATDAEEFGFPRPEPPRSQSGDPSTSVSSPENSQMDRYRYSVESTPQTSAFTNDDGLEIDDVLRQAQEETKRLSLQNAIRQRAHLQAVLSQNSSQESLVPQNQPPSQSHTPVNQTPVQANASMHPFTVHEAQERAHSTGATPVPDLKQDAFAGGPSDPSWSAPVDISSLMLNLDDAQEDEDWVR